MRLHNSIIALALVVLAAAATAAPKPDPAAIRQLVEELGADKYTVREKATKRLIEIGEPAEQLVRQALESDDPEVQERAKRVLFQIGIDPKILAKVDSLMKQVSSSGSKDLATVVAMGKEAVPSLVHLCAPGKSYRRIYCMIALTRIQDPRSYPMLAKLFQDPQVSGHMSGYVSQIKDPRIIFQMIKRWQRDGTASDKLRTQIQNMSGQNLGDDPKKWMEWVIKTHGEKLNP